MFAGVTKHMKKVNYDGSSIITCNLTQQTHQADYMSSVFIFSHNRVVDGFTMMN
jgi:hypothetical protein